MVRHYKRKGTSGEWGKLLVPGTVKKALGGEGNGGIWDLLWGKKRAEKLRLGRERKVHKGGGKKQGNTG